MQVTFLRITSNSTFLKYWLNTNKIILSTKYTAVGISEVEDELESQKIKHKHHPGRRSIQHVVLPDQLVIAAKRLIADHGRDQLLSDSKRLNDILQSRKLPVEKNELRNIAKSIEAEILSKENVHVTTIDDCDDEMKGKLKVKILAALHKKVPHWKPLQYNSYHSLLYIVRRLAPEYAALKKVFMEIIHCDPNFFPQYLFDFGSGVGSVSWVAHSLWGKHIKEYFCVDSSSDMNTTSQLLLQGGKDNEDAEMILKGVFFRQFLPASHRIMYDLVVSAYSLMELPSAEHRLQVIDILWQKCSKYLVIIEHGSNAGYTAVLEARDYILKLEEEANKGGGAHVIAPCPHDLGCPRFMDGTQTPCNFEVHYQEFPLDQKINYNTERFSYVILRKEPRPKGKNEPWPRIVREALPRTRHVVCRMCCADGQLHEVIFTKYKHGRHLYRCARSSQWGDLIPAKIVNTPNDQDTTEELKNS